MQNGRFSRLSRPTMVLCGKDLGEMARSDPCSFARGCTTPSRPYLNWFWEGFCMFPLIFSKNFITECEPLDPQFRNQKNRI
jgi:hypothetical protein